MQPVSKAPLSTTPDVQPLDDAHGGNGSANGKPATGSAIQIPAVQMPMAELVKNDPPLLQLPGVDCVSGLGRLTTIRRMRW